MSSTVAVTVTIIALAVALVGTSIGLLVTGIRLRRARRRIAALENEIHGRASSSRSRRVAGRAIRAVATTATRVREGGVSGLLVSSIEDLTRWATEDRAEIVRIAAPDGTVTIMFSDIEDSTALNERLGDHAWLRLLAAHDKVVRDRITRERGHVVKTQGDGFMVVFRQPDQAVRAAASIQAELADPAARRLRETGIRVRIGIHTGVAIARDGDYFGRNVAMAARVASRADGGEIVVSDDVRQALETDESFRLEPFEVTELKGLDGLHELWAVSPATASATP